MVAPHERRALQCIFGLRPPAARGEYFPVKRRERSCQEREEKTPPLNINLKSWGKSSANLPGQVAQQGLDFLLIKKAARRHPLTAKSHRIYAGRDMASRVLGWGLVLPPHRRLVYRYQRTILNCRLTLQAVHYLRAVFFCKVISPVFVLVIFMSEDFHG